MIDDMVRRLAELKREFVRTYAGTAQVREPVPLESESSRIDSGHLRSLHAFASANPIYYNSYEETILGIPCMIYEGDANKFWLGSIGHTSSRAPFSPTWIVSAYTALLLAIKLGAREAIDVGSGDGRISYCARVLGLDVLGVEIDPALVDLQNSISDSLSSDLRVHCADAASFEYSQLDVLKPAFFISGLAQMGGDILARSVIGKMIRAPRIMQNSMIVFIGTRSPKYPSDDPIASGWRRVIEDFSLEIVRSVSLPTAWTLNEQDDTPYIFTRFAENP